VLKFSFLLCCVMDPNARNGLNLRLILDKKLIGTNFIVWYPNLIIVLKQGKRSMFLRLHMLMSQQRM
jgi:hypothetical protein